MLGLEEEAIGAGDVDGSTSGDRNTGADAHRGEFARADDEGDVGLSIGKGLRDRFADVRRRCDGVIPLGIVTDVEDGPSDRLVAVAHPDRLIGSRLGARVAGFSDVLRFDDGHVVTP